jgi:hypothetical protein
MSIKIENEIFKGPVTCCEYFDEVHLLFGKNKIKRLIKNLNKI